jgi:two-component sensor histidine kinase
MGGTASIPLDNGLDVQDLASDAAFAARRLHVHNAAAQTEGMLRIARAFVEAPETVLQELVNAAVDLCGADSAGISLEQEERTDANYYKWVATAGQYKSFLNAVLPRYPSACSMCLERGQPQIFRVGQPFFDLMGVAAPTVTDGILLPWETGGSRGTIWIVAHGRTEAFDAIDLKTMQLLADFAATAVLQQQQQKLLLQQAGATAARALAHELAHQINNPLQSLTNLTYMAAHGGDNSETKALALEMSDHVARLALLVKKLVELPLELAGTK